MYHGLSEKKAKHNSGSVKQWVWEALPYRVLYFVKHRNRLPPNAIINSTNEFFRNQLIKVLPGVWLVQPFRNYVQNTILKNYVMC